MSIFHSLRYTQIITGSLALLTLSACGGSGDSDNSPTTVATTFPLSLAVENIAKDNKNYQFRISENVTENGRTTRYSGGGIYSSSNSSENFEGAPSIKRKITSRGSVIESNTGASYNFNDSVSYYFALDFKPIGYTDSDTYCLLSNQAILPVAATVGQSASWYDMTCYSNSGKNIIVASANASYTLEGDTENSAIFKITLQSRGNENQTRKTVTSYRVTTAGLPTLLSEVSVFSSNSMSANTETIYQ